MNNAITTGQYIEALRAVLDLIDMPLARGDQDDEVRSRILACRAMSAASFIQSLLGISDGDSLPMDDFNASLAYLRSQVEEFPVRYATWDDADPQAEAPVYRVGRPPADAPESEA